MEKTYLMLKKDDDNKRFAIIFYKPKKKKKSQTGIPELVKATGNVMAADTSAVNTEMESFSKKKLRRGSSYRTSIPSRAKGKYKNMHIATDHKLQLILINLK